RPPCARAPPAWTSPSPAAGASVAAAGAPSPPGSSSTSCVPAWFPSFRVASALRADRPPSRGSRQPKPLRRPGEHEHVARLQRPVGVGQLVPTVVLLPTWMHGEDGDAVAGPAIDVPQTPADPALRHLDGHHPVAVGPLRLGGLEPGRDR